MRTFNTIYKHQRQAYLSALPLLLTNLLLWIVIFSAAGQICPPNIDFEKGRFDNWECFTGTVAAVGGMNVMSLVPSGGPVGGRHTMYSSYPSSGLDPYGGFPINCPNGSGHSIKLGNDQGGGQAEGIAYTFTIPANENAYTLIYNYAVVFQDPNHLENEQPRMEIEITNVTDNSIISCASFAFRPYGTALPGFQLSNNPGSNTPVWYKDWTAVSINLAGNAGKTIKLLFKTSDCTFRRHFGYAYIDVNSECSGTFTGATYCPNDTVVNVLAPYGYQGYSWYNQDLTQLLGKQQVLTLKPPPAPGTIFAVKLEPYNGYGCPQTLYTQLIDTLTVTAIAGPDTFACNRTAVQIGTNPRAGLRYEWRPAAGLSNPNIANPLANPDVSTTYIVTTRNSGGGCIDEDTVIVKASIIDTSIQLIGSANYCLGSGDSAILRVQAIDSIQWYKDNSPIRGANKTEYRVTASGSYYAVLLKKLGCSLPTAAKQINISSVPVAGFTTPDKPDQCLVGNQFAFKNSSANALGEMNYTWDFGDGRQATTRDCLYNYSAAGTYRVKMVASSSSVCADSTTFDVQIYPNAVADFSAKSVCVNTPFQAINSTADTLGSPVNYRWNLGNGQVSNLRNPPSKIFSIPGTYTISLSVNTAQCPSPLNTATRTVVIEKPSPGIRYPTQYAIINLPLALRAREVGESILWTPATSLNSTTSFDPVFRGPSEQLYTIQQTTTAGCVTVDTQIVKTVKNVEVNVPTAFTPNNDGKNDYLKPILMGVKQLRYFTIFNRWGQVVFEMRGEHLGWDGNFRGSPQQTQTVVWMAEVLGVDGNVYKRRGTTVLLR